jgi:hypothetical protein
VSPLLSRGALQALREHQPQAASRKPQAFPTSPTWVQQHPLTLAPAYVRPLAGWATVSTYRSAYLEVEGSPDADAAGSLW